MSSKKEQQKKQLAKEAFTVTLLYKVMNLFFLISIITFVLAFTVGWLWLEWEVIWKIGVSCLGVLACGVLINYLGPIMVLHHFSEEIEKKVSENSHD